MVATVVPHPCLWLERFLQRSGLDLPRLPISTQSAERRSEMSGHHLVKLHPPGTLLTPPIMRGASDDASIFTAVLLCDLSRLW